MTTSTTTLASRVWPVAGSWPRQVLLVVLGSLFIAVCAQINLHLPLVPVTLQTFAVLTIGAAFGWRLGAAAVVLYLLEGVAGLPVFAEFKNAAGVVFTWGYLVGFVLAAGFVGWFAERGHDRNVISMFGVMMLGTAIVYVPGLIWLGQYTGFDKVLELGLFPFIWGDLLKAALAAVAFPVAWSWLGDKH